MKEKLIEYLQKDRTEASRQGHLHYYTGKPCSKGHLAPRHVFSGSCVLCSELRKGINMQSHVYCGNMLVAIKDPLLLPQLVGHLRLVYAECLKALDHPGIKVGLPLVVRVESASHVAYVTQFDAQVIRKAGNFAARYVQREYRLRFNGKTKTVLDTRQEKLVEECRTLMHKNVKVQVLFLDDTNNKVIRYDVTELGDELPLMRATAVDARDVATLNKPGDGADLRRFCVAALKLPPRLAEVIATRKAEDAQRDRTTQPTRAYRTFAKAPGSVYVKVDAVTPEHCAGFMVGAELHTSGALSKAFVGEFDGEYGLYAPVLFDMLRTNNGPCARLIPSVTWLKKPGNENHQPEKFRPDAVLLKPEPAPFPLESWTGFNAALELLQAKLRATPTGAGVNADYTLFDLLVDNDSRLVFLDKKTAKSDLALPLNLVAKNNSVRFLSTCSVGRTDAYFTEHYNAAVGARDVIVTSDASIRHLPFVVYLPKFFTIVNKLKWEQ